MKMKLIFLLPLIFSFWFMFSSGARASALPNPLPDLKIVEPQLRVVGEESLKYAAEQKGYSMPGGFDLYYFIQSGADICDYVFADDEYYQATIQACKDRSGLPEHLQGLNGELYFVKIDYGLVAITSYCDEKGVLVGQQIVQYSNNMNLALNRFFDDLINNALPDSNYDPNFWGNTMAYGVSKLNAGQQLGVLLGSGDMYVHSRVKFINVGLDNYAVVYHSLGYLSLVVFSNNATNPTYAIYGRSAQPLAETELDFLKPLDAPYTPFMFTEYLNGLYFWEITLTYDYPNKVHYWQPFHDIGNFASSMDAYNFIKANVSQLTRGGIYFNPLDNTQTQPELDPAKAYDSDAIADYNTALQNNLNTNPFYTLPAPIPDVEPLPEPIPDIDPIPDKPEILENYMFDLSEKFPFCLPFDLIDMFKRLRADPETPHFEIPIKVPALNYDNVLVIDLSRFDGIAKLLRTLLSISFIITLIVGTRNLIK